MKDDCVQGAKNEQRIISLEHSMVEVQGAIVEIRDRLLGRPSWSVLAIITFLTSSCVGLLALVLR